MAAQWGALAPPASAMLEAARRMGQTNQGGCEAQQQQTQDVAAASGISGCGDADTAGSSSSSRGQEDGGAAAVAGTSSGEHHQVQLWWWHRRRQKQQQRQQQGEGLYWAPPGLQSGDSSLQQQATVADAMAVELGLRQLQELGVEGAVMATLAEQARVRRAMVQLPQAVSGQGQEAGRIGGL